ncbi:MAG: hypothetical protein KGL11_12855 [Alphaproteobacteria bacterium]|nr:hypothetical protein [Alphaproteobacteria bacterium]
MLPSVEAHADRIVELRSAGDFSLEVRAIVRHFLLDEFKDRADLQREYGRSFSVAAHSYVAIVDLSDRGALAYVIVPTPDYCGTAGCDYWMIQPVPDAPSRVLMDGQLPADLKIRIMDRKDLGYHRICDGDVIRWTGAKYEEIERKAVDRYGNHLGIKCNVH